MSDQGIPAGEIWSTCESTAPHQWHQISGDPQATYCIGLREDAYYQAGGTAIVTSLH
jgi:hypothetical protein